MENLGRLSTVLVVGAMVAGIVIGVRSIPDIRRYLKIREM